LFIDGLTHLNEYTGETPYPPSKAPTAPTNTLDYKNKQSNLLKSFYLLIKEYVKPNTLLILDDISVLLYNGYDIVQTSAFILQLKALVESVQGTLLTVMHADEETFEDVEGDNFIKNILYGSNLILQVQPLNSGLARDVHGQLDIVRGSKSINSALLPQSMHYKILDNNVHFFAKGVSQV
jgi:hypothetical protein